MKHDFHWELTEEEFERLRDISAATTEEEREALYTCDDYFGAIYVGSLCCEFMHTLDMEAWYPFVIIYALGIDDGYGYTNIHNTPYSLLPWDFRIRDLIGGSFEEFKTKLAERFSEELEKKPEYNALAALPLGDWT